MVLLVAVNAGAATQVAATQRAGRAGRTGPGKCFRLYTRGAFASFEEETVPEIQRCNLANTVLYLKVLGVHDVLGFDFIDPPSEASMCDALKHLFLLGALDIDGREIARPPPRTEPPDYCITRGLTARFAGRVTSLGLEMSHYPLEPSLARFLIDSVRRGCCEEALTVAAMLSVESVFYRPPRRDGERTSVLVVRVLFSFSHVSSVVFRLLTKLPPVCELVGQVAKMLTV
jgi:ATP-dependent RNA helicase DHX8/PRP22